MAGGGGIYANMFDAHPPFQIDGKTLFRESESNEYVSLINNGVGDNCSALQHIYPAENIGLSSSADELEIANNSLAHYNSDPERLAWHQGNNYPTLFALAARIGWDSDDLYDTFKSTTESLMRPNCTDIE